PKPRQKPHPPVWVACSRRDTIHLAAEKGIGALTFAFIDPEEAQHWVSDYYETFANECVPIGDVVNPNVAAVTTFMCAPTEEEAIARGSAGSNFFGYSLGHYYLFGQHQPGVTDVWREFEERRAEQGFDPEAVRLAAQHPERLGATAVQQGVSGLRGSVGTPDQIREYLQRYEDLGVDQVVFVSQAGRNRHEHIMESLELFGKTVLPEFAERDEKRSAEKQARLAPVIEQVMARKPAEDHPPLPSSDYSFPATPREAAERAGADEFLAYMEEFANQRALGIAPPRGTRVGGKGGSVLP
ncbi:MAG: LLM class flavin-dependent oxidoreductase, partial [Acidimicrobiales bacterium]